MGSVGGPGACTEEQEGGWDVIPVQVTFSPTESSSADGKQDEGSTLQTRNGLSLFCHFGKETGLDLRCFVVGERYTQKRTFYLFI